MFQGLRTTIYQVADLNTARAWYQKILGVAPHFDQPFYVGFNVAGCELGLQSEKPAVSPVENVVAYWGVANADLALAHLLQHGATLHGSVQDVGDGIQAATVRDPFGNVFGIIYNPHFAAV